MKLFKIVWKNLQRNKIRTALTSLATFVLVLVVTAVWSLLSFLDGVTSEKSNQLKAIVTERWQIPSQMPFAYAAPLSEAAAREPTDERPLDAMTWQFFGGTLDPKNRTRNNIVFAIAMEPRKMLTMMDELDNLPPDQLAEMNAMIDKMAKNPRGIIVGRDRLKAINKRVGERFVLTGLNYKDLVLEFEIVGVFPVARYDQSAVMNRDYLNNAMDDYAAKNRGQKHPMALKTLNLVWLRVNNQASYQRVSNQIMNSPSFRSPAVKLETESSAVSNFLEAYRDIFWGLRWLLSPAILATLALINANAISISVRERQREMAVMKVLGFLPNHIMFMVLAEALLIGTLAGLASAGATYFLVNDYYQGLKFPIAFFPAFFIPPEAIAWGLAVGLGTSLVGALGPAISARTVRVAEVFSRVA